MRTINRGRVGQRLERAHVRVHLRRRPFEQPSAAHCEQRVADEGCLLRGEVIGDMAGGVRRDIDHRCLKTAELHHVAALHQHVERRDAVGLSSRAGDGAAAPRFLACRLDRGVPARVVGVPVRVPDVGDPPAARLGCGKDGFCNRGVHNHRAR